MNLRVGYHTVYDVQLLDNPHHGKSPDARAKARTSPAMVTLEEARRMAASLSSKPIPSHAVKDIEGFTFPAYTWERNRQETR